MSKGNWGVQVRRPSVRRLALVFLLVGGFSGTLRPQVRQATRSGGSKVVTYTISGTISATGGKRVTLTLSGTSSATVTASSSGTFSFKGLASGSYTVIPSYNGYSFSPASASVTVSGANVSGVNFATLYSIVGTIKNGGGSTVTLGGAGSATATAGPTGAYSFTGLPSGSYTVTPALAGMNITPATDSVTIGTANVTANFTAVGAYGITGTVTLNGAPLSGVAVALSGSSTGNTTTNSSGNYSFSSLTNGSFTVTPSAAGYTFSPAAQAVTISGSITAAVNFAATPLTYSISGVITPSSNGSGAGATVTLGGAGSATTVAGSTGTFTFTGLPNGAYTITPAASGAVFTPATLSVTINGANKSGANFTASGVIFYDNFSESALSSQWFNMNQFGDPTNNELECYVPTQVTLNNALLIQTQYVPAGVTCGSANTPSNYASGSVIWAYPFSFTYGTVEFKAEMPGGTGTWPALWLLGYNCQPLSAVQSNANNPVTAGTCDWPNPGSDEIDITEILNSNHTSVNQQVHSSTSNQGCTATTADVSQNYHVYDLIWTASSLTWEIDGVVTCTVPGSAISATPKFLIIDTAVGGTGGGTVNNATFPQTMTVDYVQVTQP